MEEKHPGAMAIELHEEFVQHIEKGAARLRALSIVTVFVSSFLALNYFLQLIVLPYVMHVTVQTVNLTDPALQALGFALIVLSAFWLYVAISDIMFVNNLSKQISEIRKLQKEMDKKLS